MQLDRFKGNRSDYWNTPKKLYEEIMNQGYVDYNPENSMIIPFNADVPKYKNQKVFINPPFSILNKTEWIFTITGLLNNNNELLLLLPARTDTKQFHELLSMGLKVRFIKGRLNYNDEGPAPFPSLFMYNDQNETPKIKELRYE